MKVWGHLHIWPALALCALVLAACDPAPEGSPADNATATGADTPRPTRADRLKARETARGFRVPIETALKADHDANKPGRTQTQVAQAMAQIDLSATPTDFQTAYTEHIYAWALTGGAMDALHALEGQGADEPLSPAVRDYFARRGVVRIARHDAALRQLTRDAANADAQIEATWNVVTAVAQRYGAYAPTSDDLEDLPPAPAPAPDKAAAKAKGT